MNLRIFGSGDPAHRVTLELLPWYVNGTLEGDERVQVEAHLSACLPCRRELEAQRSLQSALSAPPSDPELAHALARMHAHLNAAERGGLLGPVRRLWDGANPLLRGALVLQLGVILALAAVVALRAPDEYRTLSSQASGSEERTGIAVMFKDGRSEQEVRGLLAQLGLRIVDGPTEAGAYTLAADAGRRDALVAALQGHPAVKLALPLSLPDASTR